MRLLTSLRTSLMILSAVGLVTTTVACGDSGTDTDGMTTADTDPSGGETEAPGTTTSASETDAPGTDGSSGGGMVDYQTDIQPIWDASCSCHMADDGGMMAAPYLTLNDGLSEQNLVMVPASDPGADGMGVGMNLVTPGDTANSYLWLKINGGWMEAGGQTDNNNSDMPPIGSLSQDDIDKIEAWING